MKLLLLLSAILSALTGVGGTMRGAAPVQAVAQGVVAPTSAVRIARSAAVRPTLALPTLVASSAAAALSFAPLIAIEPLWASRRRE